MTVLPKSRSAMAIVRAEIASRIEEAWDTLRRMPDRDRAFLRTVGQKWPEMIHSADEHAGWKKRPTRRPPPTARQIDRMDEVLDWMLKLAHQETKFSDAVWHCCGFRKTIEQAAKTLGFHAKTIAIHRDNGLDRIHEIRSRVRRTRNG